MIYRKVFGALLIAGLTVITTGCADSKACTLIGSNNGLTVAVAGVQKPGTEATITAVICIADGCIEHPDLPAEGPWNFIEDRLSESPLELTVNILDQSSNLVAGGTGTIAPNRYEPNGPGCGTWYNANVVIGNGTLTQS